MSNTVEFFNRFWRDRSGAAAEYAVILAIVGSALVVSFLVRNEQRAQNFMYSSMFSDV